MNNETSVLDVVGMRAAALMNLAGSREDGIVTSDVVSIPVEVSSRVDIWTEGANDTGILNHTVFFVYTR